MARRVAAVLILVAGFGLAGTALLARDEPAASFSAVSNRGTPATDLDLGRAPHLPRPALTGEAFLIGQREDRRFYRLAQADGGSCWATARLWKQAWRIGAMSCQQKPQFPSRAYPLHDFSPIEMSLERPHPHFLWLAGIAADGVQKVAVIDADNRVVPAADVADNVYFTRKLPAGDFYGLAALDGDGEIVWRSSPVQ